MATKMAELMQQAAEKLDQMDYGSVIQLYQKALALAPNNAGAAMGLVMVFNRVGKSTDALAMLQKLWPAAKTAKGAAGKRFKAAVLAQIGVAQQQMGQLQTALDAYTQAQQLVQSDELQQRINQIKPLVSNPEPVQQLLLHAHQLVITNKPEQARKVYVAALQLHADSIEALRGLAALERQRGAHQEALPLLQKALILAPDRPELYNELGMVFQDRGDLAKAISFHKRAIKVDARFASAHINLGVAYKRQGKSEEAIAAYRAALALAPNSPEAHNNLGNLLRIAGDLAGAKSHLEKALALRPGYADARANLQAVVLALHAAEVPAVPKPSRARPPAKKPATKQPAQKKAPAKAPAGSQARKAQAKPPAKPAAKPAVKVPAKPAAKAAAKPAAKAAPSSRRRPAKQL